jgi:hypothetical protein
MTSALTAASPDAVSTPTGAFLDPTAAPVGAPLDPLDVIRASPQIRCGRYLCGQRWLITPMLSPQSSWDSGTLTPAVADTVSVSAQTADVL